MILNRLRIGFSHLREHKFRHNFSDTNDLFCNCRTNSIETTEHYLFHCPNFSFHRKTLFENLQKLKISLLPLKKSYLMQIILYGDIIFNDATNRNILNNTIIFLKSLNRFSGSLML